MVLSLDKDFAKALAPLAGQLAKFPKPAAHDVESRRSMISALVKGTADPTPDNLFEETIEVSAQDGHKLSLLRYQVKGSTGPGPAVLHMHGGGYFALDAAVGALANRLFALQSGVQIFSVDYRLAPEHPYPTPLEDCWAALQYIIANASELGVDVSRIAVMGESAGGGLAAALTLLARERGLSPPLARQILVFPMLDDRNKDIFPEGIFTIWNEDDNLTGWTAYLGTKAGGPDVPVTAAPGRVTDVSGLPPLYMDVGQLDHFLKEDYAYVEKFIKAGIEVEFHVYPGLPHAWGAFAPEHPASVASFLSKVRQLQLI